MILRMFSTDSTGKVLDDESNFEGEVNTFDQAFALVAADLVESASDEFLTNALTQFAVEGKVDKLREHTVKDIFWNVTLTD